MNYTAEMVHGESSSLVNNFEARNCWLALPEHLQVINPVTNIWIKFFKADVNFTTI